MKAKKRDKENGGTIFGMRFSRWKKQTSRFFITYLQAFPLPANTSASEGVATPTSCESKDLSVMVNQRFTELEPIHADDRRLIITSAQGEKRKRSGRDVIVVVQASSTRQEGAGSHSPHSTPKVEHIS
jgi:hypothetical protein